MSETRLLLIEDDYDVADMLIMYFQSHDYVVLHSDNGTDGIELARTRFPALIVLDLMLPDMDGYDVCIKLRHTSLTRYIPIIFLTQRDGRSSKVKGLELGADDYITKPFDIDELRLRVQGSIRRATRENIREARTGLPTGPMVTEEIQRRDGDVYTELVFRIEGWAEYNDVYGFVAGNSVLNHAGKTIQSAVADKGTQRDFVGIIEDEFIVLTHTEDVGKLDAAIKERFDTQVKAFYSFADAERGGITLNADTRNEHFVPFMHFALLKQAFDG